MGWRVGGSQETRAHNLCEAKNKLCVSCVMYPNHDVLGSTSDALLLLDYPPWDSSRLQLVGDVHIPGPDIELPLPEAQHPTQHRARVDPDTHVNVVFRTRAHISGRSTRSRVQLSKRSLTAGLFLDLRKNIFITNRTKGALKSKKNAHRS